MSIIIIIIIRTRACGGQGLVVLSWILVVSFIFLGGMLPTSNALPLLFARSSHHHHDDGGVPTTKMTTLQYTYTTNNHHFRQQQHQQQHCCNDVKAAALPSSSLPSLRLLAARRDLEKTSSSFSFASFSLTNNSQENSILFDDQNKEKKEAKEDNLVAMNNDKNAANAMKNNALQSSSSSSSGLSLTSSRRRNVLTRMTTNIMAGLVVVSGLSSSSSSSSTAAAATISSPTIAKKSTTTTAKTSINGVRSVQDPETYAALVYDPRKAAASQQQQQQSSPSSPLPPPPLLVILHGAAQNKETSIWNALGSVNGEHAGLPMQLLVAGTAPQELSEQFCVAAPYVGAGRRSFYNEPRRKLLKFVTWLQTSATLDFDPERIFLFGFSDGATVAVELATSRKFRGIVVCSYGFTGASLPLLALERLKGISVWVFHAADDVIFHVQNSDRLVAALQRTNKNDDNDDKNDKDGASSSSDDDLIRYNRYDKDPLPSLLGIPVDPSIRGHTVGIMAAQTADVYTWLLAL